MLWQKCRNCGKPFQCSRSTAKYCSSTCRAASFRSRHKKDTTEAQFDEFEVQILSRLQKDYEKVYDIVSQIYREHSPLAAQLALRACGELLVVQEAQRAGNG